jgi:16S rRNA processing protein RimM
VVLGRIVRGIGLRGELKLLVSDDFWAAALGSAALGFEGEGPGDGARRAVHVRRARAHGAGAYALTVDGVTDRTAADACVGLDLVLDTDVLDVAPPDAPRPFQLREARVLLPDGTLLGRVTDVLHMPAQQILVVQGAARQHWIPNVAPLVQEIDLGEGIVRIQPIPGLLDL